MNPMRRHPIITVVLLLVLVRMTWNPVMRGFFGGNHVIRDKKEGEWVGQVEITGGYKPSMMGNTPGPHQRAVIHFNLKNYNIDDYHGPGEFFIIGEDKPREIRIESFSVQQDTRLSCALIANPDFAGGIDGIYLESKPDEMTFKTDGDLAFSGVLHQGTIADYNALVLKLQTALSQTSHQGSRGADAGTSRSVDALPHGRPLEIPREASALRRSVVNFEKRFQPRNEPMTE